MKKKNLKNLTLHKHRISNLTLLHKKIGGIVSQNTTMNPYDTIIRDPETNPHDTSEATDCASWCYHICNTNGATTKAKPPTENEECNNHHNQHVSR
ncbi:hypothetical protein [uncultured Kordia sp.]|uniref:hypothetical protein n=1 Tax=uncultured Kordia sp. TaxID=507699 RepID=UPI002611D212|nr:hypothetical protein [uncultured Kordia sp.]